MSAKLQIFMAVVIAHWAEHLSQVYQIYGLGWAPHAAGGMLGYLFPWLAHSEVLHFSYAVVMMIGLVWLRGELCLAASGWWTATTVLQGWHLVEHTLLQVQALTHPFFGRDVPTSIIQLWYPRVELHLFYNTIVTVPMAIALWREMRKEADSLAPVNPQVTSW
jgi:hypothetical protein